MATTNGLVLLGASDNPPVEIISTPEGFKLALSLSGGGPFDSGLSRKGYVFVTLGYAPHAISDDDPMHNHRLREGWRVVPSADPERVPIDRYFGRSKDDVTQSF